MLLQVNVHRIIFTVETVAAFNLRTTCWVYPIFLDVVELNAELFQNSFEKLHAHRRLWFFQEFTYNIEEMCLAQDRFYDVHHELAFPKVKIFAISKLRKMRYILGAQRKPLSIGLHRLYKLPHCLHYMIPVHSLSTVFPLIPITNPLSKPRQQPRIFLTILPHHISKEVKCYRRCKCFVYLMSLLNNIPRQQRLLIKHMYTIWEVYGLLNFAWGHQVWQKHHF